MTLSADEARHLRDVLRLHSDDEVHVFNGEGHEYRARVVEIERDLVRLDSISEVEPERPESPLTFTLAVALLKGDKFDLVVQKATELGVTRIVPVMTTRADVRLRDAEEAKRKTERWRRIALESAKQCGRARLLEIGEPVVFESLIGQARRDVELRLMFAERDGNSLSELVVNLPSRPTEMIALVGSEGGWDDGELAQARREGWEILTLGGRTLRAETAAIAIAALLQHAFGDLV